MSEFEPIKYLVHGTNINNLINIINTGYLLTQKELKQSKIQYDGYTCGDWECGGQFVGVYMTPEFEEYVGSQFGIVVLIFNRVLLYRNDYHINDGDFNGILTTHSYSRKGELDNLLSNIKTKHDPEIIFHNNISLKYLEKILINSNDYKQLIKLIPNQSIRDESFFKKIIFTDVIPNLIIKDIPLTENIIEEFNNYKEYFCNVQVPFKNLEDTVENQLNDLETYIKIARNCGMNVEELNNFFKNNKYDSQFKLLRRLLHDSYELPILLGKKELPKTIYYPPFDKPLTLEEQNLVTKYSS